MPEESKRTCEHCGSTDVSLPKGLGYYFCFDCKHLLEEVTHLHLSRFSCLGCDFSPPLQSKGGRSTIKGHPLGVFSYKL